MHRKPREAKAFYLVCEGLLLGSAALVLTLGMPLGLLTNAVQALNGRGLNLFTGAVIAISALREKRLRYDRPRASHHS